MNIWVRITRQGLVAVSDYLMFISFDTELISGSWTDLAFLPGVVPDVQLTV